MKIDSDNVVQGDQVWHDRYGWGNVVRVQSGTCDVKFNESTKVLTFTDGGYSGGFKVLWWRAPYTFVPRKGVDYSKFENVVNSVLELCYEVDK